MILTEEVWSGLLVAHVIAASLAMVLGAVNLIRGSKGNRPHRVIGRTWVGLMYFTAISSFPIQMMNDGHLSWIHALSTLTIITLSLGLWHGRRRHMRQHAANMIGTYAGLIGAFIGATVVPTRLLPETFASNPAAMLAIGTSIVAAGLAAVALIARMLPEPARPPAAKPATGG